MTANHPYPAHIQSAVAQALYEFEGNPTGYDDAQDYYNDLTDAALQALWDASRVDSLDQLYELREGTKLLHHNTVELTVNDVDSGEVILPAHVIYWGDHDD